MADSLLATLFGMLDSRTISGIAERLGAPEQPVSQGLKSSIASILGGMASKSEEPNVLRSMLDRAPAGETTFSQMAAAVSDPNSPLIAGGRHILSGLFGNSQPAITDAISAASGLKAATTSTLLSLAAPVVMSFLSKRVRTDGMSMTSLGNLLQRESGNIRQALPVGLADTFWPSTVRTATATPVVAQTVERVHSYRWIPLLVALGIVAAGLSWLMSHARRPVLPAMTPPPIPTAPLGTANRAVTDSADIVKRELSNADLKFDTGSAKLQPDSQSTLDDVAATLNKYPDVHVKVDGYTDSIGNAQSNLRLSQVRANNVVAILVHKGISADRLTAEAHGQENPVDDNSTNGGRANNRHVTLQVWQP